tara:strand:- start:223 stop:576 length:354 start_codon:yes stop_codon:yes gene_type:complete
MNEIKKMFEHWRKFLDETILAEVLTDKSLKTDTTDAKTFIDFFVRSRETAIVALEMIQSSIRDYKQLKTLSIDSDAYRKRADSILRDPDAVAEDEIINKYIIELKKIENQLKVEYNL